MLVIFSNPQNGSLNAIPPGVDTRGYVPSTALQTCFFACEGTPHGTFECMPPHGTPESIALHVSDVNKLGYLMERHGI